MVGPALVLTLMGTVVSGCGVIGTAEGEARRAANEKLETARSLFEKAGRGYTDPTEGGEGPVAIEPFRVQTLAEAAEPLNAVINSDAPEAQKRQARQLLAEVHAARARYASGQASDASSALLSLRSTLRAEVDAARLAAARAGEAPEPGAGQPAGPNGAGGPGGPGGPSGQGGQNLARSIAEQLFLTGGDDGGPGQQPQPQVEVPAPAGSRAAQLQQIITFLREGLPEAPDALNTGLAAKQQRQQALAIEINDLEQLIAEQQQQIETLRQKAEAHFAEAQELRQQAFDADGQKHFDLLDQAAAAEGEQREDATRADQLESRLQVNQARLADLKQAQQATQAAQATLQSKIESYQTQLSELNQRQANARETLDTARTNATVAVEALQEQHQRISEHYAQAAERINQAIDTLEPAVNQAPRDQREALRAELLNYYVERARILSEHASVTGRIARAIRLASRTGAVPSESFNQAVESLSSTHGDLVGKLSEAVTAGSDAAEDLSSGAGEEMTSLAEAQRQRLENYQNMVSQDLGAGASPAGANP
jgi:hypothetical protein